MAELADALDSGSSGATRTGSSPATRTNKKALLFTDKSAFLYNRAIALRKVRIEAVSAFIKDKIDFCICFLMLTKRTLYSIIKITTILIQGDFIL